jgi:hypothetical protein
MAPKECDRRVEYSLIENRNRSLEAKRGACLNGCSISLHVLMVNTSVVLHILHFRVPSEDHLLM